MTAFKPKSTYVTYIAAAPEKVWAALTSPDFTRQYFFGRAIEIDLRAGGDFILRRRRSSVSDRHALALSRSARSSGDRAMRVAAIVSPSCATLVALTIGAVRLGRVSSQATAICPGFA
jgi:Activator of Hsp90 ATPase homolog 1-like protein